MLNCPLEAAWAAKKVGESTTTFAKKSEDYQIFIKKLPEAGDKTLTMPADGESIATDNVSGDNTLASRALKQMDNISKIKMLFTLVKVLQQ